MEYHREIFSESAKIKPNLNYNNHFLIDKKRESEKDYSVYIIQIVSILKITNI